jgi:uncharacterized damage-inducible protein DinB
MTWIAPEVTRTPEPFTGDERAMLDGWLDWHRQTLLHKCSGLTEAQLKLRSVQPSTLSLLGLVRHMVEVERGWFRGSVAGQAVTPAYCSDDNRDGDFDDVDTADAQADLAAYHHELGLVRAAVADLALDHTFLDRHRGETSLRWVYLHMIEEYARHNGHADLLRERIDGVTGD